MYQKTRLAEKLQQNGEQPVMVGFILASEDSTSGKSGFVMIAVVLMLDNIMIIRYY